MGSWASPLDALFLIGESPETLMHVGELMPFTPPPGESASDFVARFTEELLAAPVVPPWNHRLLFPRLKRFPVNRWVEDRDFDLSYHVRRSALPAPGGERELGVLVSRLHSIPLDFTRPPWEFHLIEGLQGDRFAVYTKIHHSLIDGFSGVKLLARGLSEDPDDRTHPLAISLGPGRSEPPGESDPDPAEDARSLATSATAGLTSTLLPGLTSGFTSAVSSALTGGLGSVAAIGEAWVGTQLAGTQGGSTGLVSSYAAPETVLGGKTGRNRRFATQKWPLARLSALAAATGGTINDVLVAACGGALRRFLLDLDALRAAPLVGFLPVNVRAPESQGGGNLVGATLVSLGTDSAGPRERMAAVIASTRAAKAQMEGLGQNEIIAYSGLLLAPAGIQAIAASAGLPWPAPRTLNLCISNLPGPTAPLYLHGARLEATYPLSIVGHSMALNITAQSYNGDLDVGFIGCRDTLPSLQRIAVYAGEALDELTVAFGVEESAHTGLEILLTGPRRNPSDPQELSSSACPEATREINKELRPTK